MLEEMTKDSISTPEDEELFALERQWQAAKRMLDDFVQAKMAKYRVKDESTMLKKLTPMESSDYFIKISDDIWLGDYCLALRRGMNPTAATHRIEWIRSHR